MKPNKEPQADFSQCNVSGCFIDMFFIHKYIDGSMVKFTKVPQVRHKSFQTIKDVKKHPYLRLMKGRIVKVVSVWKETIDTTKYADSPRSELVWKFKCVYLDDHTEIIIQPSITMVSVNVKWINLFFYRIWMFVKNSRPTT